MRLTRRAFCSNAALTALTPRLLRGQTIPPSASNTHVDVAVVDHDRILTAAAKCLTQAPTPLTSFPAPKSPGSPHDFFSEVDTEQPSGKSPDPSQPVPFTAHRDALIKFSIQVCALTAAYVLTKEDKYADHAADHLRAWFIDPAHRMTPSLPYAQLLPGTTTPRPDGILDAVHLAEVAQAVSFIAHSDSLSNEELNAIYKWFADYLDWLGSARIALLARDQKNHVASAWLLQAAAFARLAPEPSGAVRKVPVPKDPYTQLTPPPNEIIDLAHLRHHYRAAFLRGQVLFDGSFPHEVTTPWPYRYSLFNLDMLAGICDLLSTRFESAWTFELQDGPSMRVATAHHFPFIANRASWPYPADATRFKELPLRHPALLFAGRAYSRPEYIALWQTLPADPTDPVLQRTFPIRQPLLWIRRAPAME